MAVPALGIGHEGAKKQERNMQFIVLGLVASGGALRVQNRSAATQLDAIAISTPAVDGRHHFGQSPCHSLCSPCFQKGDSNVRS